MKFPCNKINLPDLPIPTPPIISILPLFLLLMTVLAVGCCNSTPEQTILARYHSILVSADEFREAYFERLLISNQIDNDINRLQYLNTMLQEKIIAERALAQGLIPDTLHSVGYQADRNRRLIEAFFQTEIAHQTTVPDSIAVRQAWLNSQMQWQIWQIFTQDKIRIDSLYQLLLQGGSPETILPHSDSSFQYRYLGWVKWGDLEPHLEEAVIQTSPGQFSTPIHSIFGWHIVGIVNRKQSLITTEYDFQQHQTKIRKKLIRRTQEKSANQYIIQNLYARTIQINKPVFIQMEKILNLIQSDHSELKSSPDLSNFLNQSENSLILADLGDFTLTQGEFFTHWPAIPESVRKQGLISCIHYAVRDQFLVEQALTKHLDQLPWVRQMMQMSLTQELNNQYRFQLRKNLSISAEELYAFYLQQPHLFISHYRLKTGMITFPTHSDAENFYHRYQNIPQLALQQMKIYNVDTSPPTSRNHPDPVLDILRKISLNLKPMELSSPVSWIKGHSVICLQKIDTILYSYASRDPNVGKKHNLTNKADELNNTCEVRLQLLVQQSKMKQAIEDTLQRYLDRNHIKIDTAKLLGLSLNRSF